MVPSLRKSPYLLNNQRILSLAALNHGAPGNSASLLNFLLKNTWLRDAAEFRFILYHSYFGFPIPITRVS